MKIICERNILIHEVPKWKITEGAENESPGAVPSQSELKKGRKHHITLNPAPQDCPDWCEQQPAFQRLVEKGVIQVINFASTPVSVAVKGQAE